MARAESTGPPGGCPGSRLCRSAFRSGDPPGGTAAPPFPAPPAGAARARAAPLAAHAGDAVADRGRAFEVELGGRLHHVGLELLEELG